METRIRPEELRNILKGLEDAHSALMRLAVEEAVRLSSGEYSTEELMYEWDFPYSRRNPKPVPYDDPAVINAQTGAFRAGWHVAEEPSYSGGGDSVSGSLDNSDPKANDIRTGVGSWFGPMTVIERPTEIRVGERVFPEWPQLIVEGIFWAF